MIMQETMILQVCITDGISIAMSRSGILFSNNDDSGILQGNKEWVTKLFEIVEALPVHDTLQTATPEKADVTHDSAREELERDSPDTSGHSTREQSHKSN